jgi:hypothetical protein
MFFGVVGLMFTYGVASVLGDGHLAQDPSGAASVMGPGLCPPDTVADVVTTKGYGYDEKGKKQEETDYELHCKTDTGKVKDTHGTMFRLLWTARFIPEASVWVAVSTALFLIARLIRRGFSRVNQAVFPSPPPEEVSPPPTKKARRKRRR